MACSAYGRILPSKLLLQVYIKQILTPRPQPFLRDKGKRLHTSFLHLHRGREVGAKRSSQPYLETIEALPVLNLEHPQTEGREGSPSIWHVVPCIVPVEILRVRGGSL